ncbi:MAG TPA: hypothetical protein PLN02_13580 [Azonexus sp.]|nr:hypothetical protein [Azonexus sp.]
MIAADGGEIGMAAVFVDDLQVGDQRNAQVGAADIDADTFLLVSPSAPPPLSLRLLSPP